MKYPYAILIFFFTFIIQTTVLHNIAIMGYSPNLLLCLVVVFTFLYKEKYGLILGVLFGLLLDLTCGQFVGISALAFLSVHIVVSFLKNFLNQEHLLPDMVLSLIGTVIYYLVYWALYALMGSPYSIVHVLISIAVLMIYNLLPTVIFHLLLVRGIIKHRRDKQFEGNLDVIGRF